MRPRTVFASLTAVATALPLLVAAGPVPVLNPDVVPDLAQEAMGCDPLDPALCLFPFPNDAFTVAADTATGRQVDLAVTAMPRNGTDATNGEAGGEGKPVDPTEWNRNDGFSPGAAIMTFVPGLDLHRTWATTDRPVSEAGLNQAGYFDFRDTITDPSLSLADDAPMVILDADTRERHPFWAELDQHPETTDDRRALVLRPAVNLLEGHRYIVALRDLKDGAGGTIPAGPAFAAHRDGTATGPRAEHLAEVLDVLADEGIARDDLYLAWDFTVASGQNLAERMLSIRDQAFAALGDTDLADLLVQGDAPTFVVDGVEERTDNWTDSHGVAQTQTYRRIDGRVEVPNFLDRVQQVETQFRGQELPYETPVPGSRFYVDPTGGDDLPDVNPAQPTLRVPFTCDVPTGQGASYGTLYGHGLLGTRDQIGDVKTPRRHGFAGCGLDFWGMSSPDLPTVAAIIGDLSNFPSLADRAQQGFLNFLVAGRAMVHPDGFVTDPAFQDADGSPLLVVDEGQGTRLFYDGNSQGGIMGGSIVAVSPDVSRGILGVPGMNYSTLLQRSVDWEGEYAIPFYANYQDPLERELAFGLMQMLWDRGEANGYAQHMTTQPYANTPAHEVMLQVAFSDHQVSNHAAEVEARTIGAPIMSPGLPVGRHWERAAHADPTATFTPSAAYPYAGSALVYWDSGNATPPNGNLPASAGGDPHGHPRSEPAGGWQEAHFLLTGWMVDVCGGGFYLTDNHPDNAGTPSCRAPQYAPGTAGPGVDAD